MKDSWGVFPQSKEFVFIFYILVIDLLNCPFQNEKLPIYIIFILSTQCTFVHNVLRVSEVAKGGLGESIYPNQIHAVRR